MKLKRQALIAAVQIGRDQMKMAVDGDYGFRMMGDDIDEEQQLKLMEGVLAELKHSETESESEFLTNLYEHVAAVRNTISTDSYEEERVIIKVGNKTYVGTDTARVINGLVKLFESLTE